MRFFIQKMTRQLSNFTLLTLAEVKIISGGSHGDKDEDPRVKAESTTDGKSG
ncbi:hypothetical protein J8Z24_02270 [Pseudoalteromonas sp. SCSIO 43201]|uniref:hypothetical protein n=1 Tax=Pseudoalteromonas TaxID=53246 RepID=UPI002075D82C|nr:MULTISPECIES: hypothetical protein [Pseudoalteromonas]MDW7549286.1 hypothetical protein [Pseudoalteromonas peptidolytica]USD28947.1 hypothetical protein J8Z24_02270 [Pseudoalteromonas sp. SCSIO 43201]